MHGKPRPLHTDAKRRALVTVKKEAVSSRPNFLPSFFRKSCQTVTKSSSGRDFAKYELLLLEEVKEKRGGMMMMITF